MPQTPDVFSLRGRTALITGASGHLGRVMAAGLAAAGACVVVSCRRRAQAEELAAELPRAEGVQHFAVEIDHLDPEATERGFQHAVRQAGSVDVLVNNAQEPLAADWSNVTAEQFNRQLQNATGYFLLARLLRDHVVARPAPGSVILLGSMYGLVGSYPAVYEGICPASPVAYHALKGGIIQMTRHLAVYWARDQVRVNCLSPGPFPSSAVPSALLENLKARTPLQRIGQPEELIGPLIFLASDASSFVTGHNLVVDGGWTAW